MNIGIIGAGVTGLALGRLLSKKFDVEILESKSHIGGIASTQKINNMTYHPVGGHCLNSKHLDVMEFIFAVMARENFNQIKRNAKILFKDTFISYPVEFAIKEIYEIDSGLAFNITKDFLNTKQQDSRNLEEWFVNNFGYTLAQEYFIPYNKKIWRSDLKQMDHDWVADKLPTPSSYEFFESLIKHKLDTMPHLKFYYPISNNQNDFLTALGDNLNIVLDYQVDTIHKENKAWIVNNQRQYDILINTAPLDQLMEYLTDVPSGIRAAAKLLRYNKVSTMLWESEIQNFTWLYMPSERIKFHRAINIGSFFTPKSNCIITEAVGEVDYDTMRMEGEKLNFLNYPLAHNISQHAYVIFDKNTKNVKKTLFSFLQNIELITAGRFGEWEYYNMDICIKRALEISNRLIKIHA